MYAILDDQSNRSLARTEFFNIFHVNGNPSSYTLGTCAGQFETKGRRASDFIIASLTDGIQLPLPTLIECNQIPDNRDEIPTPEIAHYYPHMKHIASCIPALEKNAQILLLLGRDILRIHKVRQQCNGPHNSPYAQRLDLGWVIVGDACIGKIYRTDITNSLKTNVLINGRPSYFEPCPNHYHVKEKSGIYEYSYYASQDDIVTPLPDDDNIGSTVFHTTQHDNKLAPSIEDKEFLKLMDKEFYKDDSNSWVAPLPFRNPRQRLPNNRVQALSRLFSLQRTLKKDPKIKEHFVSFMQKMFENKHAEPAPPLKEGEECWYLPSFGIYHPRKPGQIRVVFDSSAQYEGMSLNSVLLTGPNLTNSLLGVLIRFRKEPVAFMADIQQMFYCFIVREDNMNYLRFLWHHNNDTSAEIIDYRMRVHVFGNSPSPAVAIYGLRRTAQEGEMEYGTDARQYVERDFYVDDGIKSVPTDEEAIDLLKRTQKMLSVANLRLHKIVSNSSKVLKAFPPADHATDLKDLDLGTDTPPVQQSLGLHWNISTDEFVFKVSTDEKPYTRRGVLSIINSLYDPLGFVAPVTIQGKSLLRQLSSESKSWDTLLPIEKRQMWEKWKDSLKDLEKLCIPRCYASISLSTATVTEIYIFSDASTEAIAAVDYLKVTDIEGKPHVGFILGKAKLAPRPEHTIPRLELCAAVLAVKIADLILSEIDIKPDAVNFYTDSRVVLGYINNLSRRFYVYVNNRVERIRRSSKPEQWHLRSY
ncbi:uncharacterized protein LOC128666383 [Bombina bombina]|uniref:uncharacterized protein LOC128666383 n=1 Tax=Bombina bombina TaxID=8345 RepID=UPI00235ACE5D|nr:uncharacterized protein LOC128666383 [Bombina bombina]XP_053576924.1 uncharacterized protein LOC128666383 [Bombina bombina]XP_053576925.1 uncharacterized protein LOC128666383 [Bombina bombina]XP_053576926.1 uncharacterized protein LOC128666383 [Bombina bombina]